MHGENMELLKEIDDDCVVLRESV